MKEMTIRKVVYGLDKEGSVEGNWIGPTKIAEMTLQDADKRTIYVGTYAYLEFTEFYVAEKSLYENVYCM